MAEVLSSSPGASSLINSAPSLVDPAVNDEVDSLADAELDALRDEIYALIRHIHDPEHPHTIEQLGVVYKTGVTVSKQARAGHQLDQEFCDIEFKPTVPHCSLATLIGLCIRTKVMAEIPNIKVRHVITTRQATDELRGARCMRASRCACSESIAANGLPLIARLLALVGVCL